MVTQRQLAETLATLPTFWARCIFLADLADPLIEAARNNSALHEIDDSRERETPIQVPQVNTIGYWTIESHSPVALAALVGLALSAAGGIGKLNIPRAPLMTEAVEDGSWWRPSLNDFEAISGLP